MIPETSASFSELLLCFAKILQPFMDRTPLLTPARFSCPSCATIVHCDARHPPAYLKCHQCGTGFVCNPTKAKRNARLALLVSVAVMASTAAVTVVVLDKDIIHQHAVYAAFAAVFAVFLLLAIHSLLQLLRLRGRSVHNRPMTVEFSSAKSGNVQRIDESLKRGFDVNSKSAEGITCLQVRVTVTQHASCDLAPFEIMHLELVFQFIYIKPLY